MGMGQIRQPSELVPIAVLMGHPGDGHESGLPVDATGEGRRVRGALGLPDDAQLDAPRGLEVLVERVGRVVVQVVHHHVVPRLEAGGGDHDVLALACGEEEPQLLGIRAEEARHLPPHLVGLRQHPVERDGTARFRLGELGRRLRHRNRRGGDVGGVQVDAVARHREVRAHAQGILGRLRSSHRGEARARRNHAQELAPIQLHALPFSAPARVRGRDGGLRRQVSR